jgi:hypothetical protein
MEPRMFSGDEKLKIKKLFAEGIQVMGEVNALNEGLSALRIAYKNKFADEQDALTEVEEVLQVAGHL